MRLVFLATVFTAMLAPGLAAAQSARTFVSGDGSDSNPCTVAAPCRSFAQALSQTSSGGEILVLDAAGYGPLAINKAVSIVSPTGVYAGITVPPNGTGVAIYSNVAVTLRGLTINGAGVGATGIAVSGGGTVEVHDCTVRGVTQNGIIFSDAGTLLIADTTVTQSGAAAIHMRAANADGRNALSMSRVKLTNSDKGFNMIGASGSSGYATMDGSIIAGNNTGISLATDTGSATMVTLFSSASALQNNTMSYNVGTGTSLVLEKTSSRPRGPLASMNNGKIYSFGDNAIFDGWQGNAFTATGLR